jgi:MYXO-CTERM domain-containing protein
MTVKRSIIAMSGAAFLLSTPGALNAQQSPPQPPPAKQETTVVGDHAAEWGWIGLLGLLGLAGLFGGRDRFVGTRPPRT